MYPVKFTTAYKKSYKLMKKRGFDLSLLDNVVDTLRCGQKLDEKYRDRGLSGSLAGFRECHIKPDWLLIYLIENNILTAAMHKNDRSRRISEIGQPSISDGDNRFKFEQHQQNISKTALFSIVIAKNTCKH